MRWRLDTLQARTRPSPQLPLLPRCALRNTGNSVRVGARRKIIIETSMLPWAYSWERFPAAWFGGNATNWESDDQLAAIGRYSLAILGWQMLITATNWTGSIYAQLAQAAILKRRHPSLPVFVYAGFGSASGFEEWTNRAMYNASFSGYFMQSTNGAEYSHAGCQQMRAPTSPRCANFFWNFANASARDYFVSKIVQPLAEAPFIDGVFVDGFDEAYSTPERKPWGRPVINVPNCSDQGGCELLLSGALDVAVRTTKLLNSHSKVPIFANPAYFHNVGTQRIWLNETRLVSALQGLSWIRYYEYFRAESALDPSKGALLPNMLQEVKRTHGFARLRVRACACVHSDHPSSHPSSSSRGRLAHPSSPSRGRLTLGDLLSIESLAPCSRFCALQSLIGLPGVGVHTYYHQTSPNATAENPTAHMAAFLLGREEGWYYFGSTGWLDSDFVWSELYDRASRCGRPLAPASIGPVFHRSFEGCSVRLDCTVPNDCVGTISWHRNERSKVPTSSL